MDPKGISSVKDQTGCLKSCGYNSLLYAWETWTTYSHHLKKLSNFHLNCLRSLMRIRWQDKVPDTEVLQRSRITSVSAMVMKAQLRWSGHVVRMPGNRLPQKIFYGELVKGKRSQGGQRKRYKDCLKSTLNMDVDNWEQIAQDRKSWHKVVSSGPSVFDARQISDAETKRRMPSQAYSQLFQIQSSAVHSAEEGFM